MKNIISKNSYYKKLGLILFLVLIAFTFSTETNAQGRHRFGGRIGGGFYHASHYFAGHMGFHYGHYFAPRIGARFRALPYGYTTFWIGGFPYYYYDGFWFEYYPAFGYYAVVNKPAGADNAQQNQKFDQVIMKDGSTLEGVFQGATNGTVTLRVGNEDHTININDIASIRFAPAIADTLQTK
jgi:hypothetical protein